MAHDLLMGRTNRDWSCGKLVVQPRPDADKPWVEEKDPAKLGESARSEIARAASLAVRLSRAGRLPRADKDQFASFHRKWTDFYSSRRGRWGKRDVLLLWNFREAAKKLGARLSAFESIAKIPARAPSGSLAVGAPPSGTEPPAPPAWALLVGAALALFGVGVFKAVKSS